MIKALRVFYRKSDEKIVWTSSLEGEGIFPRTIDEELNALPNVKPDGLTPLGGSPNDYNCIETQNVSTIEGFFASDENTVLNEHLQIGKPRPPPTPPIDWQAEWDNAPVLPEQAKAKVNILARMLGLTTE